MSSDDIFSPIASSRMQPCCECLAGADEPAMQHFHVLFIFPSGNGSVTAEKLWKGTYGQIMSTNMCSLYLYTLRENVFQ